MTDQFATVTVVPNEEIRRAGAAQLGDLLFSKPGITGSSFAPGASSRPIIRGLDVNSVGIVENGANAGGVSDLGEDHFVPIDPLATNQVEVIRGPAAMRYGSTSIGGVVSATNNRIPDALPSCPAAPFQTYGLPAKAPLATRNPRLRQVETRTAVSSVDRGVEGGILLDAGGGNFAVHADAYGRKASDYSIPSYPYLFDQTRPVNGRQPNSAMQADGASVGGSYIFHGGFIGAAITQNDSLYRIPGIDGADHQTRIDARQTKLPPRANTGRMPRRSTPSGSGPARPTISTTKSALPIPPIPRRRRTADLHQQGAGRPRRGADGAVQRALCGGDDRFGLQAGHQKLTAPSPDDPGSPLNGLWDPNKNTRVAGYVFNEFKFTETTKAQIAGRIEHVNLSGTTPAFIPEVFDLNANPATSACHAAQSEFHAEEREHRPDPESAWANWSPASPRNMSSAHRSRRSCFRAARTMRPPPSTSAIPIWASKPPSRSRSDLRRATGPLRFEATAYYTKFNGFIYRRLTGNTCEDVACVGPADPPFRLS